MDMDKIPAGKNPPYDCNVIIEIPLRSDPVKYELDKASGAVVVDRFLHTAMFYPVNYGFIPHTLSDDGDPVDVMVVGRVPVVPGCVLRSRPIGVLIMEDEAGMDEKILAVPVDDLHPFYTDVHSFRQLPMTLLEQIAHFFAHYKDLEGNKWAEVKRWGEAREAEALIIKGIEAVSGKVPAAKKAAAKRKSSAQRKKATTKTGVAKAEAVRSAKRPSPKKAAANKPPAKKTPAKKAPAPK